MTDRFDIDADLIRKLADLLSETDLAEIEYEAGGKRVRVVRPQGGPALLAPAPIHASAPVTAAPAADPASHPGAITSPMVGTVYLSPSPQEPPFAGVGDAVREGQTLLLVEAMKTFNEVKAPRAGTLLSIAVTTGQPVEYGELLAIVE